LARINSCSFIDTPRAEAWRQDFIAHATPTRPGPVHATLAYHWARMIEALYCAESLQTALQDPLLLSTDLHRPGAAKRSLGIGVIEAPRGTLFHHYEVNNQDLVTRANLIVSTTSNNQAMNESIRQVASEYLDGQELTEALLNHIEVAVRAYDPCLSCATHAVGKMPLEIELLDAKQQRLDLLTRNINGEIHHGDAIPDVTTS
jgi:NAD-reducing hydrogenase large subunit